MDKKIKSSKNIGFCKKALKTLSCAIIFVTLILFPILTVAEDRYAIITGEQNGIELFISGNSASQTISLNPRIGTNFSAVDLASNGYSILFNALTEDNISRIFLADLSIDNAIIGNARLLLPSSAAAQIGGTFSPDGSKVAYYSPLGNGKFELITADIATGTTTRIIETNITAPISFSVDKKQLLYINLKNGRHVLNMIPVAGGTGLEIRPASNILQAVPSPSGNEIAAVVQNDDSGLYSIEKFSVIGLGGNVIVNNIEGFKSISWFDDEIIFSANKINETNGPLFSYNVNTTVLSQLTIPINAASVSAISKNIAGYRDDNQSSAPHQYISHDADRKKTESLLKQSIVFMTPDENGNITFSGTVPIDILARDNIMSIRLTLNGNFINEGLVIDGHYNYNLNTRGDKRADVSEWSGNFNIHNILYDSLKEYPDGEYTLSAAAKDLAGRIIDTDEITIYIKNSYNELSIPIPSTERWVEDMYQDSYVVNGISELVGYPSSEFNAKLLALALRLNRGANPDGTEYAFQTAVQAPPTSMPITYGDAGSASMPETINSAGAFTINSNGAISFISEKNIVTHNLAMISLTLPSTAIAPNGSWTSKIMVVGDIFSREIAEIQNGQNTYEAIEIWDDGRVVGVVKTSYILTRSKLFTSPTNDIPGKTGVRANPKVYDAEGNELRNVPPPFEQRATARSFDSIGNSRGVRFSWIDLSTGKVLKARDIIKYTVSANDALLSTPEGVRANAESTTRGTGNITGVATDSGDSNRGGRGGDNSSLIVQYNYELYSEE